MSNNNTHKISFKGEIHPARIDVYIDKDRVNAISLYPTDRYGNRLSDEEMAKLKPDFVIDRAELKVRDIKDIALAMNEETFDRFCELWRNFHAT